MIPTIKWEDSRVLMIDQRKLPAKVEWYHCRTYRDVIQAIKKMVIRGAPAIGIAAAMGLSLGAASIRVSGFKEFKRQFDLIASEMLQARPTAVNLKWAVERMTSLLEASRGLKLDEMRKLLKLESQRILEEDIEINKAIGIEGAVVVPYGANVLTHCNAGALATGGYGTALGVIRAAHEQGKGIKVFADETRPWLQGIRLTAFEMMEEGIPVTVIVDSAAGSLMRRKMIDLVITGADRIAANGDTANKIGTYSLAVLAGENNIPFYIAAPLSTIDISIENGDLIPVEERDKEEVCKMRGRCLGPKDVEALNPAFDITPAKYLSGIITEKGILRPPFADAIKKAFVC
ncbi:MAG: S-methyl-5-thioribose-1-phosphate isomerase [Deltaproteobacteria bacterium CG_4_8_14_3_um_filter_51_11]|nr:S-methyl-5-thioribose-1-phosphate isomerase [bacterium]OIP40472.1 MAG: S-methyl-5-thioribose-1-phosphate isomerase [Desulfobacteraceae bacterium CG2_30_51_40]PIP45772.1 MAG: S-methyl-5-thioribose-1-phosphate isomerase [Deltaproteobacteria bacterium CG23_combo_of_CG06-09_8_20_14_all_51_20]PIX18291.1 MAG: S-methyl-5-thioribose-1-phosphate isomerase [Deltaproteobacteria bacterium CG_4_8_14_3_um_filter_51_11]PIY21956.1 MAG: S-methyl-5-thioribose-1-phosphate isomerase [Deltaproteobacteria bacteri